MHQENMGSELFMLWNGWGKGSLLIQIWNKRVELKLVTNYHNEYLWIITTFEHGGTIEILLSISLMFSQLNKSNKWNQISYTIEI